MKLSLSFAKLLTSLLAGGTLPYGSFKGSNQKIVDQFISDGVLEVQFIGAQQRRIYCREEANLHNYLISKHGITSLRDYVTLLESGNAQRNDSVRIASDSKLGSAQVFKGFFVSGIGNVKGFLGGNSISIGAIEGAHLFIYDYEKFAIPPDVVIVVVENYLNFRECNTIQKWINAEKLLFVWRFQNSKTIRSWLKQIPNEYIHFGDFDPMGLQIYATEFRRHLPASRCQFYYPPNLDELIGKFGKRELYEEQKVCLKTLDTLLFPELEPVVKLIKKYRKGLEQEILISM